MRRPDLLPYKTHEIFLHWHRVRLISRPSEWMHNFDRFPVYPHFFISIKRVESLIIKWYQVYEFISQKQGVFLTEEEATWPSAVLYSFRHN